MESSADHQHSRFGSIGEVICCRARCDTAIATGGNDRLRFGRVLAATRVLLQAGQQLRSRQGRAGQAVLVCKQRPESVHPRRDASRACGKSDARRRRSGLPRAVLADYGQEQNGHAADLPRRRSRTGAGFSRLRFVERRSQPGCAAGPAASGLSSRSQRRQHALSADPLRETLQSDLGRSERWCPLLSNQLPHLRARHGGGNLHARRAGVSAAGD